MNQSSKSNVSSKIDLSVFKEHDNVDQCNENSDDPIQGCYALKRLIFTLKYYSLLDVTNNKDGQDIFEAFVVNVYTRYLDDYIHLVNDHNNLKTIYNSLRTNKVFTSCDIINCCFTSRHHSKDSKPYKSIKGIVKFYAKTMDSLHFYIFHLFECGLRTDTINNKNNHDNNDKYLDTEFTTLSTILNKQQQHCVSFHRFNNNNKFKMGIQIHNTNANPSTTFMDQLYGYLFSDNITQNSILTFQKCIESDEYDTDAIKLEFKHNTTGYIALHIDDKRLIATVTQFIELESLHSSSFNIGLTFYYWKHYKHIEYFEENTNKYNLNDHGHYKICDLYIPQKYPRFKQEIVNLPFITIHQYEDLVIKVKEYMLTQTVKKLKAKNKGIKLKYDIKDGDVLSFNHILSVLLYTDYINISDAFSATFHPNKAFESLESIKARNACYWWMAKSLRETVQLYGIRKQGMEQTLTGPFYCFLSNAVPFPQFEIRLCGPTSTSFNLEMIHLFMGKNGAMIELNNTVEFGHRYLCGFKCGWLSQYKEESEVLFMGGHHRIKLESIRIMNGGDYRNYYSFLSVLSKFNNMFNGGYIHQNDIPKSDELMISSLFEWMVTKRDFNNNQMDDYVIKTFSMFCLSKRHIIFCLYILGSRYQDKELRDLIFYSMKQGVFKPSKQDKTNVFRNVLFKLFPNIEYIDIYTTMDIGGASTQCQFCFYALLSAIENESFNQITIKAANECSREKRKKGSWIYFKWLSQSKQLKRRYKNKGYHISLTKTKNVLNKDEDCIVIKKL